jgi:predicted dehydrogenase
MDTRPRLLIIGAGSRGNAYAEAVKDLGIGFITAVAEPDAYKRQELGSHYIWKDGPVEGQSFDDWRDFLRWQLKHPRYIDGIFICTLDEMHMEIITALAPLKIHIMCEKPLATTLQDCQRIYQSLKPNEQDALFSICHVLRYSPHNILLHQLLKDGVVGDIISMEHTEPVGWWHFSHSYVRYVRDQDDYRH